MKEIIRYLSSLFTCTMGKECNSIRDLHVLKANEEKEKGEPHEEYEKIHSDILVLLDNGHGSDTIGKCSPCGTFKEYKFARKLAAAILIELQKHGIRSELLVPEEEDVSLSERVRRANDIYDYGEKCIVISIHVNAAGNGSEWKCARGWSAYTSKGYTTSDLIAYHLYLAAEDILGPRVRKYNGNKELDWEENFYILRKTKCPAVLTENMFMDNHQDLEYLNSEEGFQDLVDIHVKGLISYIKSRKSDQ